jgi:hypothetical protein
MVGIMLDPVARKQTSPKRLATSATSWQPDAERGSSCALIRRLSGTLAVKSALRLDRVLFAAAESARFKHALETEFGL